MTLLAALAVFALAAIWIVQPILGKRRFLEVRNEALDRLIETKHAIYRSILDLELDHRLGKVSDEDYVHLRKQQEADAVAVLREIDQTAGETDLFDSLEAEIAAARTNLRKEMED